MHFIQIKLSKEEAWLAVLDKEPGATIPQVSFQENGTLMPATTWRPWEFTVICNNLVVFNVTTRCSYSSN